MMKIYNKIYGREDPVIAPCPFCMNQNMRIKTIAPRSPDGQHWNFQIICPECGARYRRDRFSDRIVLEWNEFVYKIIKNGTMVNNYSPVYESYLEKYESGEIDEHNRIAYSSRNPFCVE